MRVFITGASGFVGTHLAEFYSNFHRKDELHGTIFGDTSLLSNYVPHKHLYAINLLDSDGIEEIIKAVQPDVVIHLAALAAVGISYQQPRKVLKNNILIAVNVLEAVRKHAKNAKLLLIGSADEYGQVQPGEIPIREEVPLRPTSPYAVSKISIDYLGLQYFLAYKLNIIRLRPFNHIGEGQGRGFAVPDFAYQIAMAEKKQAAMIKVGNLSAIRDFTDVKDMVQAYYLALEKCIPGEIYNVGSGKGVRMQDLLNILIAKAKQDIRVEVDPKLYRPVDVESVIADPTKFMNTTGWKPTIPLEVSLDRVLNYWRKMMEAK